MKRCHVLGDRELELKPYRPDQEKTPQVKEIFHILITRRVINTMQATSWFIKEYTICGK